MNQNQINNLISAQLIYESMGPSSAAGKRPKDVGKGYWKPTSLQVLRKESLFYDALARVHSHNPDITGYNLSKKTLLPGAGDLRRAVYLAIVGFSDITAMDINPALLNYGQKICDKLIDANIILPGTIKIQEGDFLDDTTHEHHGQSFLDFENLFAYLRVSNADALLSKVEQRSKPGTLVTLLESSSKGNSSTSLPLVRTLVIPDQLTHFELKIYQKPN